MIQIKYFFRIGMRQPIDNKLSHKQMVSKMLQVNERGLINTSIYAQFDEKIVIYLPKGVVPITKVLLDLNDIFLQTKAIHDKYTQTGTDLETNITSTNRNFLIQFFQQPQRIIQRIMKDKNINTMTMDVEKYEKMKNCIIANVFDSSALQILELMKSTFTRFKRSPQFKRILKLKHISHNHDIKIDDEPIVNTFDFDTIYPYRHFIEWNRWTIANVSSRPMDHKELFRLQSQTNINTPQALETTTINTTTATTQSRSEATAHLSSNSVVEPTNNALTATATGQTDKKQAKIGTEWSIHEIIGKGAFGIVHRGTNYFTRDTVALKFIIKDESKYHKETAINEIKILKELTRISHPNVIKLEYQDYRYIYTTKDGEEYDTVLLVMEYASNGQLFDILRYSGALSDSISRTYFHRIISALKCFHQHQIVHRDLKPENILLNWRFNIKICDFGLSIIGNTENTGDGDNYNTQKENENKSIQINQRGRVGTRGYMAPEILNRKSYDESCDIFSAGVILYNLLTGRSPFKEAKRADVKYKLLIAHEEKAKVRTNLSNYSDTICQEFWNAVNKNHKKGITNSSAQDLIQKMIKCDPEYRIKINQIEQHPWFSTKTNENQILDDEQLFDVMKRNYETARKNKLQSNHKRKSKDNGENKENRETDRENVSDTDTIDQAKTLAEFEATLSQVGVRVHTKLATAAQVSLVTIPETREPDNHDHENSMSDQSKIRSRTSKRQSLLLGLQSLTKKISGSGSGGAVGGGHVLKLTQYMSSKVTSDIQSWDSIKYYTIKDPLVVMVGIGDYHGDLQNLIGMSKDYKNMIYTFNNKYNYSFYYQTDENKIMYTKNSIVDLQTESISTTIKLEWNEDEILDFFESARNVIVKNNHDSLIGIISSHGDSEGVILDSDMEEVSLLDIFANFMQDQCPYLQDKPKLMFVDACRGDQKSWVKKQTTVTQSFKTRTNQNTDTRSHCNDHDSSSDEKTNQQEMKHASLANTSHEISDHDVRSNDSHTEAAYTITTTQMSDKETTASRLSTVDGDDVKINSDDSDSQLVKHKAISKLDAKLLPYHKEGNFRVIYANIDGYAVVEGGKRGGYLLQAVKEVFCNQQRILHKDTTFNDIVLQINKRSQNLAGKTILVQQTQDVNQMDGFIKFEKRKIDTGV